jgi:integrase
MLLNKLKDTEIKKAKPQEKVYYLPDGGGLRLQIKPNGSKVWVFRFSIHGKSKETTFQTYPIVTLKEAREKRDKYKKLINENINPIEYFKQEKLKLKIEEDNSFKSVLYKWLENEMLKSEKEHSRKKRLFEKDVLPHLKYKAMNTITIQDLVFILKEKDKIAPNIASKMYGYLKNLYGYAVLHGYCERNLLNDISKAHVLIKRTVKHMPKITDEKVLKELVNAIYNYHGGFSIRNCLKLVLHIPLRADNLCTLKWKEIDFENKLIIIPREQMKFKDPNLDDFKMPLSDEVINILKEQKEELSLYTNELDYVFLGIDNKKHIHKESPNNALQIMSFNDEKKGRKIRLHGFRGTFRSLVDTLDKKGIFSDVVKERALDHHDKNISKRAYTHKGDFEEQLRELMTFWSEYITNLLK